ncbi:hypothetical protein SYJ56_21335 [Algoriphagus sp. D3-2-R+10]|uniref:hypothetical protein n=1 Tax=Algoriphagus aurantiacus TaxID=3103948 RepID=UPI002B36424A|nr:hypothetical protein [Algoriphagus sp. D3-2-R+10]MEB2777871.1 hypothetical protein [Algoriphagus sp. D3-2-R+10]
MEHLKHQKDWLTIPSLPCIAIEETITFWEMMGYTTTYKMTRPYQYGIVERGGYELHFGRVKGMDAKNNQYSGCLVMVSDVENVYKEFTQRFKKNSGRVPHSGIPRISRMKPGTARFTLTDVSGNSIIFIKYGKEHDETYEKAFDENQSPLQKSIAKSIVFRDYKEDEKASAKTLDVALQKVENEGQIDIAEALLMRIDLASNMNDPIREEECRALLNQIALTAEERERLTQKHNGNL